MRLRLFPRAPISSHGVSDRRGGTRRLVARFPHATPYTFMSRKAIDGSPGAQPAWLGFLFVRSCLPSLSPRLRRHMGTGSREIKTPGLVLKLGSRTGPPPRRKAMGPESLALRPTPGSERGGTREVPRPVRRSQLRFKLRGDEKRRNRHDAARPKCDGAAGGRGTVPPGR